MKAEQLHAAAKKVREVATSATPGPWKVMVDHHREYEVPEVSVWSVFAQTYVTEDVVTHPGSQFPANAAHITVWDPDVALAVADWLDVIAADFAPYWAEPYAAPFVPVIEKAYRLAQLILREEA